MTCEAAHLTPFLAAYYDPTPTLTATLTPTASVPPESPPPAWIVLPILWGIYALLMLAAFTLDYHRLDDAKYHLGLERVLPPSAVERVAPGRRPGLWASVAAHHALLALPFAHPNWTALQRVTVWQSAVVGLFLVCLVWLPPEGLALRWVWAPLVSALGVFAVAQALAYPFAQTPAFPGVSRSAVRVQFVDPPASEEEVPSALGDAGSSDEEPVPAARDGAAWGAAPHPVPHRGVNPLSRAVVATPVLSRPQLDKLRLPGALMVRVLWCPLGLALNNHRPSALEVNRGWRSGIGTSMRGAGHGFPFVHPPPSQRPVGVL